MGLRLALVSHQVEAHQESRSKIKNQDQDLIWYYTEIVLTSLEAGGRLICFNQCNNSMRHMCLEFKKKVEVGREMPMQERG